MQKNILEDLLLKEISINKKEHIDSILQIIPELIICKDYSQNHPVHPYLLLEHILLTTDLVDQNLVLKLAALLHDIGKPYRKVIGKDGFFHFPDHPIVSTQLAELILKRLGYEETIITKVLFLILKHDDYIIYDKSLLENIIQNKDLQMASSYLELNNLQKADLKTHTEAYYEKHISHLNENEQILQSVFNLLKQKEEKDEKFGIINEKC